VTSLRCPSPFANSPPASHENQGNLSNLKSPGGFLTADSPPSLVLHKFPERIHALSAFKPRIADQLLRALRLKAISTQIQEIFAFALVEARRLRSPSGKSLRQHGRDGNEIHSCDEQPRRKSSAIEIRLSMHSRQCICILCKDLKASNRMVHPIFGHLLGPSHGDTGIHSVFKEMGKFDRCK